MTKRPMQPCELNNVRSAYRRDIVNQRQHELRSNAEDIKTSLQHVTRDQLTDWDIEALRMIDDILMDEKVLKLRRETSLHRYTKQRISICRTISA